MAQPYWRSALGAASGYSGRSESDVELVLFTVMTTLVTLFVLRLTPRIFRRGAKKHACCAKEFVEQRKGGEGSIPSGSNDAALIAEVQAQLVTIHKEIMNLKHEREVIDTELIETSTQILQTLGASFLAGTNESRDDFSPAADVPKMELPVHKPVPQRTIQQNPIVPRLMEQARPVLNASPPTANEQPLPVSSGPSETQTPQSHSMMSAPSVPHQPPQGPSSHTVPSRAVPQSASPPMVAAPKMSAIAAARMKREAEMAHNAATAPPSGAANPFGKPRAGPFGASQAQ